MLRELVGNAFVVDCIVAESNLRGSRARTWVHEFDVLRERRYAAPSTGARLVWHDRACHGRQQPDDLPDHGVVCRSGSHSRARQRRSCSADRRCPPRLGRGPGLDRAGLDVAEPRGRDLRRLCRGLPALQPRALRAHRHLLLVGLDSRPADSRRCFPPRLCNNGIFHGCRSRPLPSPSCSRSAS